MRSGFLFVFSVAFAVFFIGPALLGFPFPPYPLMKVGDVFDLLTPLVLIPLYWGLFQNASDKPAGRRLEIAFMVLAGLWVLGQGTHLAANSIGHQLAEMETTTAYKLTDFYDERLGHILWHSGVIGLMGLLIIRAWESSASSAVSRWLVGAAAVVYGLTFFIIVVEGQTPVIGVPFAAIAAAAAIWRDRRLPRSRPFLAWIGWSHALALVLLVGWWLYWGNFIEFSELGWI